MACAVLLAGLPQHDQSMQRISGASSQRLLALGSLAKAPYLHCTDRSGMCRSHQIGNTCSLRSCVLAPASRSNGHPCWDHTWPLQSACPRRLDLERCQDHTAHMPTPYQMSTRCASQDWPASFAASWNSSSEDGHASSLHPERAAQA